MNIEYNKAEYHIYYKFSPLKLTYSWLWCRKIVNSNWNNTDTALFINLNNFPQGKFEFSNILGKESLFLLIRYFAMHIFIRHVITFSLIVLHFWSSIFSLFPYYVYRIAKFYVGNHFFLFLYKMYWHFIYWWNFHWVQKIKCRIKDLITDMTVESVAIKLNNIMP